MNLLTRIEEIVLLAVYQLGDNAYGVTIRQYIEQTINQKFSVGAIYVPLDRLTRRGLLTSYMGEPTPERGGRSKRYYLITSEGINALQATKEMQDALWLGFSGSEAPQSGLS